MTVLERISVIYPAVGEWRFASLIKITAIPEGAVPATEAMVSTESKRE